MAAHAKARRLTRLRRGRTRRADVQPQRQQRKGLMAILNRQHSLGLSASSDHRSINREIPINDRFAPEAGVGAETRPVLIAVGAVGQSPYRVQQIDPHGDSIHMGNKNRMKPAVSDK